MNGGRSSGVPHTPDTPPAALPSSPGWPPRAADSRPGIGSSREKGAAERRPRRTSASRAARRFRASSHWARSRSHSAQSRRPFGPLDFGVIVLYITYPETLNKYVWLLEAFHIACVFRPKVITLIGPADDALIVRMEWRRRRTPARRSQARQAV
jgi:hypothetical protein